MRPTIPEMIAAVLLVVGVLAYLFIDPYGSWAEDDGCDDIASREAHPHPAACKLAFYDDPGAVQWLLCWLGLLGLAFLLYRLVARWRAHRRRGLQDPPRL